MSKTFRRFNNKKSTNRSYFEENEDDYYSNRTNYTKKKLERNIDNVIRSKNISKLMELNDYDDDEEYNVRR